MLRYHQQILPSFEVYPLSGAKNKHYIASNHGVSVPFFESHTAWQRAFRTQNIHCVSKKTRHQTLAHNFPKC